MEKCRSVTGGPKIMMNCRLCRERLSIVTTINVRKLERTGHLKGGLIIRPQGKYFWGNQAEEEKQEDQNECG
jgi:hypothetical protein